jgi:putative ABC transport system ATP-binding protein
VVATHDERLLALADRVVHLTPMRIGESREPERLELTQGTEVFRQGDQGELVYAVEAGEIEIVRERTDGAEELLDTVGPGGYFGELAPMFGLRRAAAARARTRAVVVGYTLRDFREHVEPVTASEVLSGSPESS